MTILHLLLLVSAAASSKHECPGHEAQCFAKTAETVSDETSLLQTSNLVKESSVRRSTGQAQDAGLRVQVEAEHHKRAADSGLLVAFFNQIAAAIDAPPERLNIHKATDAKKGDHDAIAKVPQRSKVEVMMVCTLVMGIVSIAWLWHWYCPPVLRAGSVQSASTTKTIALCLSFAACSWGMNVVNKSLGHVLQAPSLVTAAQMLITVVGTLVAAAMGVLELQGTWKQTRYWLFIPILFAAMLVTSQVTYQYLTLSMFVVVRNMGPLIALPIESWPGVMDPKKVPTISTASMMSLLVLLASTVIYSHGVETNMRGLLFAVLNMLLAITERLAQRRLLTAECAGLSTPSCALLNNGLGIFPTMVLAVYLGEFGKVDVHKWLMPVNAVLLLLSGVLGGGICYFAIALQREISATSFMVLRNVAGMATVVVGVVVFLDPIVWPWQVTGLALSFAGAIWYACIQNASTVAAAAQKDLAAAALISSASASLGPPSKSTGSSGSCDSSATGAGLGMGKSSVPSFAVDKPGRIKTVSQNGSSTNHDV